MPELSERDQIRVRVFNDGHSIQMLVDFGPRVHFACDVKSAAALRDALNSAIWDACYPKSGEKPTTKMLGLEAK